MVAKAHPQSEVPRVGARRDDESDESCDYITHRESNHESNMV